MFSSTCTSTSLSLNTSLITSTVGIHLYPENREPEAHMVSFGRIEIYKNLEQRLKNVSCMWFFHLSAIEEVELNPGESNTDTDRLLEYANFSFLNTSTFIYETSNCGFICVVLSHSSFPLNVFFIMPTDCIACKPDRVDIMGSRQAGLHVVDQSFCLV